MAAASPFDLYDNMFDKRLKPRLLQQLLRDYIPFQDDEISGDDDSVDLQTVVDAVKNFELLSENLSEEASSWRLKMEWAASVDAWCHRLLSLIQCSTRAKRCWIATRLMGLTCQECSSDRFVASFSDWLDVVLSNIDPPSEFTAVRATSCATITDLLRRLHRYSNLKEVGMLHADRIIQPVLELLNEDSSEAVLEGAVGLLCGIMNFFPEAIQHNHDRVVTIEAAIFTKVILEQCSSHMSKMYAHCLALLPKAMDNEDNWYTFMQDLLTSIDIRLNELFPHLQEGTDPLATIKYWIVPGETSIQEARRSKQLLMSTVHTLMLSCCSMLMNRYPVEVTVPVDKLLKLVDRVLKVKDSYSQDTPSFVVNMQQELIWTELPLLQLHSLDLITAMIRGACRQLMPLSEHFVGFLKTYFKTCTLPALRIKVYSVIGSLLTSMGVGASLQLAEEVISNAIIDLDYDGNRSRKEIVGANLESGTAEALLQPGYKKMKHACTKVGLPNDPASYGLKIAALEALETLLTVDGELGHLRADVDRLIIYVATNAYDEKSVGKEDTYFVRPSDPAWADFMLAALHALLASILSQAGVDPLQLSQGVELFRKVKGDSKKIAGFCAHALLVLDMLRHPREIFLDMSHAGQDTSGEEVINVLTENTYAGCHENKDPIPTHMGMNNSSSEDGELIDPLLDICNETEEPSKADIQKAIQYYQADHNAKFPRNNKPVPMLEEDIKTFAGTSTGCGIEFEKVSSDIDEFGPDSYDIKPSKDVLGIPVPAVKKEDNESSSTITVPVKTEEPVTGLVYKSSVDFDPDTSDKDSKSDVKPIV